MIQDTVITLASIASKSATTNHNNLAISLRTPRNICQTMDSIHNESRATGQ